VDPRGAVEAHAASRSSTSSSRRPGASGERTRRSGACAGRLGGCDTETEGCCNATVPGLAECHHAVDSPAHAARPAQRATRGAGRRRQAGPVAGAHARGARARQRAAAARPAPPAPLRVRQPLERCVVVRLGRLAPPGAQPDRARASLVGFQHPILCCAAPHTPAGGATRRPPTRTPGATRRAAQVVVQACRVSKPYCVGPPSAAGHPPAARARQRACWPPRSSWSHASHAVQLGISEPQGRARAAGRARQRARDDRAQAHRVRRHRARAGARGAAAALCRVQACACSRRRLSGMSSVTATPRSGLHGYLSDMALSAAPPVCSHACAADPNCLAG
jgi:hypothetical protein